MAFEEAINCINLILNSPCRNDKCFGHLITSDDFNWLEKAKEALEKQIAKKPIKQRLNFFCPSCSYSETKVQVGHYTNGKLIFKNYCGHCGQKIDWEGTK